MATDWEATLRAWVRPSSDDEEAKRDRTENEVRAALGASHRLSNIGFRTYVKGSYANRTNVRLDYDVDIAVECTDFFYSDTTGAPADVVKAAEAMRIPYTEEYGPKEFKDDIEAALVSYFGRPAVIRGNIGLRVRQNQTTLPADVVPSFEYHLIYTTDGRGIPIYHRGTRIFPDKGGIVDNWPQQQYDRGVLKNNATGRHYKRIVRALKRLENALVQAGQLAELPSFFMECLVYNVPNAYFNHPTYVADMREVLATIFHSTVADDRCNAWLEASERKYLFDRSQGWNRQQANDLANRAWNFMGLN